MEKEKRKKLKNKVKIYEKLGAKNFQKVVFKVEELKFKIIKNIFPNYLEYSDRLIDKRTKKYLKKETTEEGKASIIEKGKMLKLANRKELNFEKNRNYHINIDNPQETKEWLKWNKAIHIRGIIKDIILMPLLISGTVIISPFLLPLVIVNLISLGINFECINIQNYNLCRLELIEDQLQRQADKRTQKHIEEYGEADKLIYDTVKEQENIPTLDEIVGNITSIEQANQLKRLIEEQSKKRSIESQKIDKKKEKIK